MVLKRPTSKWMGQPAREHLVVPPGVLRVVTIDAAVTSPRLDEQRDRPAAQFAQRRQPWDRARLGRWLKAVPWRLRYRDLRFAMASLRRAPTYATVVIARKSNGTCTEESRR